MDHLAMTTMLNYYTRHMSNQRDGEVHCFLSGIWNKTQELNPTENSPHMIK